MRYHNDYQKAGVPTFPSRYSFQATRIVIAISSILAALFMGIAAYGIGIGFGYLSLLVCYFPPITFFSHPVECAMCGSTGFK